MPSYQLLPIGAQLIFLDWRKQVATWEFVMGTLKISPKFFGPGNNINFPLIVLAHY